VRRCFWHTSHRTFDLIERGEGPRLMHIGSKKLISAEAAAKRRRQREGTATGRGS
jgi:hypothetical protein